MLRRSFAFGPLAFVALLGATAAAPFACNATADTHSAGGNGGAGAGHGNGTGAGGDNLINVGGGDSGTANCVHCSADLRQVLDCNENVVKECPGDQGCGPGGVCVEACAAAAANQSTFGCDFYSLPPAPQYETAGSCFAALVANTWKSPIKFQVEYQGQQLDVSGLAREPVGSGQGITYQPLANGELAPGKVAILFLSQGPGGVSYFVPCPGGVTPGITSNPAVQDSAIVNAFHITTTGPIVAYDIYPYGGAQSFVSSATLLVPTPTWGTNYIAADAWENLGSGASPFVQIVASQDATNVTISPTAAIVGGSGVAATGQGQPATYTLNRGQAVQFFQEAELAGSPISADKPVSVWGGTSCMNIPAGVSACDAGHQQLLPVSALGNEYVAVRYRDRSPGANESVPWTIVGAVDGSVLHYDPAPPGGAPPTLNSGTMKRFNAVDAFVVRSQDTDHPFYMAGHMTGGEANWDGIGDPEYVNVVPPQQFLAYYLFLTDPTYGNTNLVFIRKKAPDGSFKDVELDCAGNLGGWQPIGDAATHAYEFTRIDLTVGGAPQGNCDNGVHTAKSTVPFGLTVWGFDSYVSYAYPAGMSTQPINTVIVPPTPK